MRYRERGSEGGRMGRAARLSPPLDGVTRGMTRGATRGPTRCWGWLQMLAGGELPNAYAIDEHNRWIIM